jgi:hypothetical protein
MVVLAGWTSVFGGREGRPRYSVGFALYGIPLFTQGTIRGRQEAGALGGEKHAMNWPAAALAAGGPVLGLAVVALIALA